MKAATLIHLVLAGTSIIGASAANADETGPNIFYFGAGSAKKDKSASNTQRPLSLGYLSIPYASDTVWGLDFSGEGIKLDSTWGQTNSATQALSFNILYGRNIARGETFRVDAALLLGLRERSSDCPASYLGYQCYADTSPNTTYGANYGAVVTVTYKSLMLGLRATGESKQAIIGLRF